MKTWFLLATLAACSLTTHAGFVYHDSAATDGGEFSTTNFPIGNLKNAGHTSHLNTEDAANFNVSYATTSPPDNGYPVTIVLEFVNPVELTKFYLWNHSNNNGGSAPNAGVKDFKLTFFDGSGGGGSQIGSVFNGTAAAAPATGTYAAEIFDLGATYGNVRSVRFEMENRISGSGFVAVRELGFERNDPAPSADFIYHDSATTNGGEFGAPYALANLNDGGFTSPDFLEDADALAAGRSYATTSPPAGGYPVSITLEFGSAVSLDAFHLWNHSNDGSGTAINQGVDAFTLTFYDSPGGGGAQIGSPFSGNAAKAPATGTYSAETFDFGMTYEGVRSVVFTADNHNPSSSFVAMREIAFKGAVTPSPFDKVIVYLVGGQSNADGYGVTGELSPELQAPRTEIDFYHGNGGGNSPLPANQWIALQSGSGSMTGNAGGFGPELNFGIGIHQALGSQNARIAVIKHTLGGTSLHTDWFPGGDDTTAGDGPVYQAFQTTVSAGLAALASMYPTSSIQLEGMVWHQGEADAGSATNADAYQTNLTDFIADVRATYGGDLKFGIVQLSDNQTHASILVPYGQDTVQAAQAAVAAVDPLNYLVTTNDLPTTATAIHFGTASVLTIGSRLADGMRRVPINDSDGNGIDDDWEELQWGVGNSGQDPGGDDDKDGLSNLEEFLWLTDPLVSNVISPLLQTDPGPNITWPSSPDRRYLIEVSEDLDGWQRLDSFIPGAAGASTSYVLPTVPGATGLFYRVGVHR